MTKTEEIILKEQFKVDDSHSKVRGFVFAYDEDENLLFTKENMIVKSGRRFIMENGIKNNCFSAAFLSENMDMASEEDTKIGTFRAENLNPVPDLTKNNFERWSSSGIPEYTETEDNEKDKDKEYYYLNGEKYEKLLSDDSFENGVVYYEKTIKEIEIKEENYFSYFIDYDNLIISCLIVFNDDNPIKASSLGLIAASYIKTTDASKDNNKTYYTFDGTNYTQYSGPEFEDDIDYYEKNEALFSRLTFPTYYKSNQQRLVFRYYIYF